MPGPVPGIHVFAAPRKDVDGRDEPGHDDFTHTTGLTPGNAMTRSRKAAPRISKLRYWSSEAQAGVSKRSPDEQSDIGTSFISIPHIAALMRATRYGGTGTLRYAW
jgi:hypothetical protein